MPNPESDLNKHHVSERLKHVDALVREKKIDEAVKEIGEIRKLDATNPYALAYEERILTLQKSIKPQPQQDSFKPSPTKPSTATFSPPSPISTTPSAVHEEQVSRRPTVIASPVSRTEAPGPRIPLNYQPNSIGKASVLVVDDDLLLLQALTEFLEDNKYSAKTFTRSDEALEYLKRETPDLVLCDVNLETSPFGGFTLHEHMRKIDRLRDVPFVFLSGLNDTAIVRAGKELGADDYLTKPVEPETLLAVVKGKIKRYRQIKKKS